MTNGLIDRDHGEVYPPNFTFSLCVKESVFLQHRKLLLRSSESHNHINILHPTQRALQPVGELCFGVTNPISAPQRERHQTKKPHLLGMEFGLYLKTLISCLNPLQNSEVSCLKSCLGLPFLTQPLPSSVAVPAAPGAPAAPHVGSGCGTGGARRGPCCCHSNPCPALPCTPLGLPGSLGGCQGSCQSQGMEPHPGTRPAALPVPALGQKGDLSPKEPTRGGCWTPPALECP